jgi:peptidoglycan hydrolase CwlO-like protein
MKKTILPVIVSLGLLSVGFMFGTVVTNGKNQKLQEKVELSHRQKIDSLNSVIKDKDWQIETLQEECQMKESEISFWGQMYDKCRGIKY